MAGGESKRQGRMGGLILAGAALLAAGTLGIEWQFAPTFLRNPFVEILLLAAGVLVLFTSLFTLILDRRDARPQPLGSTSPALESPQSSLMALPAIVGEETEEPVSIPAAVLDTGSSAAVLPTPASATMGLVAAGPSSSTLLIPFAEEPVTRVTPIESGTPGQTVSRLVDRMETLQRAAPNGSLRAATASSPPPASVASSLLLRLTRIPSPPPSVSGAEGARRCNDCGEPLGSPPHFEPCGDCGRALCERCYWRTSSGPLAHLCSTCFNDRSIPRPPTPAITFPRPGLTASVSSPSSRNLQPRRRVS